MRATGGACRLGRFTLEPRRQLLCDGHPIALGGKALDLLSVLADASGDLVTKDELMAAAWPGVIVEENAIQVHISAARKALAEEADRLVTVRGKGYRLVLGSGKDRPVAPSRMRRWVPIAAGAAALASLIGIGAFTAGPTSSHGPETAAAQALADAPQSREADQLHAAAVKLFRERTRPGYAAAEKLLRRAVAIEPRHARSWARLAMTIWSPYWWAERDHPGERARLFSEARGYAQRALALDPRLAEAHLAMGFVMSSKHPLPWLERAAALDPADPEIADELAEALMAQNEQRRALTQAQHAFGLDPTNHRVLATYVVLLHRAGRLDDAYRKIDEFERETHRGGEARHLRFQRAFIAGRLADSARQCAESLDLGDEDRWNARACLLDVANLLDDHELAAGVLRVEPRLARAITDYETPALALKLARTKPQEWWADLRPGMMARLLVEAHQGNLLLRLYDDRFTSIAEFWDDNSDNADWLAAPLALAMRAAGRTAETAELRDRFASDLNKMVREGDVSLRRWVGLAQLAALDGDAQATARAIDAAIAAGWKGQPRDFGYGPDRDPIYASVRSDARVQAAIGRYKAIVAAEAARLRNLHLTRRVWSRQRV